MNGIDVSSMKTNIEQQPDHQEKMFEELYSKADILYFVLDESFQITSVNISAAETLGYEKDDLTGKNFLDLVVFTQHSAAEKELNICADRGYIRDREMKLCTEGGTVIISQVNGLSLHSETGSCVIRLYVKDITEKYSLEKQRDILLLASSFHENAEPKPEKIKELVSLWQEGRFLAGVSVMLKKPDGTFRIYDRWDDTLSLSVATDTFRKVGTEPVEKMIARLSSSIYCQRTEKQSIWTGNITGFINEEGNYIDGRITDFIQNFHSFCLIPISSGNKGYIIVVNLSEDSISRQDVFFAESVAGFLSESPSSAAAGESYKPATEKDTAALMHVPFIGVCLVESGRIVQANKWMGTFLNSPRDGLIGREIMEFVDTQFHSAVEDLCRSVIPGEYVSVNDVVVITDSGEQRQTKITATQLSSNGTVKELWYFISREEHKRVQRTLLQARKMESLGMLAGGIVHDFNNLLACILGFSSMLSEEIAEESPHYEDVRQITVTAEKATELTSRLMAHTQGSSCIVNKLDTNQLVKEVAGILSRTLEKSISIRAQLDPELSPIIGDANKIQQAILQVALNARDAMTEGGKIIFKTRNLFLGPENPWLKYGGQPGKYIQIEVTDTGQGMSGDVKEKVLNAPAGGSDETMGIAMVKEILVEHEGFMSIFSQPQKGTVVKMHLPVKMNEQKDGTDIDGSDEPLLGKETILLVDDQKAFRETARKMLTRYGYKVISAESRSEALAIYKKYINRIDLVVIDMMMPGMDFEKVMNVIFKMNRNVKIITTSELNEAALVKSPAADYVAGYIQKPFQVRPLLNEVRSVLNV